MVQGPSDDFVGSGWAFPLDINMRGGIRLAHRERDVAEAIYIIVNTYPGERRMRPEFGCRVHDYVFAGMDPTTRAAVRACVMDALARWEPRIDVDDVEVDRDPQSDNVMLIGISYTIRATNDKRNLVFPFYRIPEHE